MWLTACLWRSVMRVEIKELAYKPKRWRWTRTICVELFWFTYEAFFLMGKATSKTLPAFFKMMGKQSSPGSWRIETVGKRNSHGRRYVGIARLEVQIPGHEDETIGLYIDSLGWQGVSFGCLSIAILIFISTVIKLSYCHHRHIVIIVTLSSSSHRYHHHIVIIITSISTSHRYQHHIVIIIPWDSIPG